MAYTPNAEDTTRPIGSDPPATLPAELRGIKARITSVDNSKQSKTTPLIIGSPAGDTSLTVTGATTINLANGVFFRHTAGANVTYTFTHPTLANNEIPAFLLRLTNGGNFTITFPTLHWELGVVPTLTEDGIDLLAFYKPYPGATFWEAKLCMRDIK
jgi:hypothetical protein